MTQEKERGESIFSRLFLSHGQKGKSRVGAAGFFVRDIEFPRVRYTASIVRTNICLVVVAGDQFECVSGIRSKITRDKKNGEHCKPKTKARGSIARVIRTSIVALEPRLIERGLAKARGRGR